MGNILFRYAHYMRLIHVLPERREKVLPSPLTGYNFTEDSLDTPWHRQYFKEKKYEFVGIHTLWNHQAFKYCY